MRIALLGRNKLGMVDGSWTKNKFNEKYSHQWERCNASVLSWLMNFVAPHLMNGAVQGTATIPVYYSRLKELWAEFENLVPSSGCNCPKSKDFFDFLKRQKLYQFLMGLNENYTQSRSQIILMNPLLSVVSANNDILGGILGAPPASSVGVYESTALYSAKPTNGTNGQRFKKNLNLSHPSSNAYNVVAKTQATSSQKSAQNMVNQNGSTGSQVSSQQGIQMPCFFTKDQYDQIVNMLNGAQTTAVANTAGATNHMVEDPDLLTSSTRLEYDKTRKVFLPTGDVAYVTHIGKDLFTGRVKAIGREKDGIYLLPSVQTSSVIAAEKCSLVSKEFSASINSPNSSSISESDICLWHKRLGHPSSKVLHRMVVATLENCKSSIKNYKFPAYVLTHFDKKVKFIRSDNGTKFINSLCYTLFKSIGIVHQTSGAYSPQQNGGAKRKHKHILEVCRAIRFQGHIPIKYWGHCVLAAVYLINRMPSQVINNKSPDQIPHGTIPSLSHLKVLGCLCFAKAVHESDKLNPREIMAVHMGYSLLTPDFRSPVNIFTSIN
ncbi:uncharacterized protein LOC132613224 [Lycium barbarum]|uniref:uncharacterized protein LOC132613224 n=1 Tax=Lycium barbarum TaxID=112863 RepID=UPI00293EAB6A|nr:uncharacterized protein LOC132613224 [Lycium barbarum]